MLCTSITVANLNLWALSLLMVFWMPSEVRTPAVIAITDYRWKSVSKCFYFTLTLTTEEFVVASFAVLFVWFKLLWIVRGFQGAGMFILMVFEISWQIRYFLIVWCIVLLGFANSFSSSSASTTRSMRIWPFKKA